MNQMHAAFAGADPVFYERPGQHVGESTRGFGPDKEREWSSWAQVTDDHWTHWHPLRGDLPEQGWKVHVSTVPAQAHDVLRRVSAYCHSAQLTFKHLRDESTLGRAIGKDADRASAGKFIAIFPATDAALHDCLVDLEAVLIGTVGPYVLSDVRWNESSLYLRYGGFRRLSVIKDGMLVPAIRDLLSGELVPDVRAPGFYLPPWAHVPKFLRPHIQRRNNVSPPEGFPRILGVLHHSNAGGVYLAEVDETRVVLKEARPHSGWTPDGRDAVDRLIDEQHTLASLSGVVNVPRPLGMFSHEEHHFLALEHIEGTSLVEAVATRNPLTSAGNARAAYQEYRDWALGVGAALREQLNLLHRAGFAHGDLHPRNVILRRDGEVTLIDLEMSVSVSAIDQPSIGVLGFVPADVRAAGERDLYALVCIELFLFLPLTPLTRLDAKKGRQLLEAAQAHFGLDDDWVAPRLEVLDGRSPNRAAAMLPQYSYRALEPDSVAHALLTDSEDRRRDRLWPGDPAQFSEPRYSLAHGALGVAASLAGAGYSLTAAQRDWISRDLRERDLETEPAGLMNGLAGAVWACRNLGLQDLAATMLEVLERRSLEQTDSRLYSGAPGVAITLLSAADQNPSRAQVARAMFDALHKRLTGQEPLARIATNHGGLFGGASGTALLGIRLYEYYREPALLAKTADALDVDIASLAEAPDGSLHVNEGWRIIPYFGYGSAGIGLVLARYLQHAPDSDYYQKVLEGIARAASAPFTVQAGLLHGRAGLIYFLDAIRAEGILPERYAAAHERHVRALELHALSSHAGTRFSGDANLRASCDLATGSAGVLAALTGSRQRGQVRAPGVLDFLDAFGGATPYPSIPQGR